MNKIQWTKKAVKQLHRIAQNDKERVFSKITTLRQFPDCLNIKKLRGFEDTYRLRVGRYRVLFLFVETIKVIRIEEVKKRDERTY